MGTKTATIPTRMKRKRTSTRMAMKRTRMAETRIRTLTANTRTTNIRTRTHRGFTFHSHGGKAHSHAIPEGPITTKTLVALGISGGIVAVPRSVGSFAGSD